MDPSRPVRAFPFSLLFLVCLAASLAPLCLSRILPFHDASGIIGLGGALAHAGTPGAHIAEFFDVNPGATPSALYFAWAYLAGRLHIPLEVAFTFYVGLFCIAGLPLATLGLLRAFDRPRYLALLVFPICYHQQIWFGFLGSAAAITGITVALALAKVAAERPRVGNHVALAFAVLFVAAAHPFSFALLMIVLLPFFVWPVSAEIDGGGDRPLRRGARVVALRLACVAPAVAFLGPWFAALLRGSSRAAGVSLWARAVRELGIGSTRPRLDVHFFIQWLGNGYVSIWDELVPAVAVVVLFGFLVFGARPEGGPEEEAPAPAGERHGWVWLVWATGVLLLGYLLLPLQIAWPQHWWGVRVRCVVPLFMVAVAAVRPSRLGLPPWATVPSVAVALVLAGFIGWDFRSHWHNKVLAGFDEAIEAIPSGQSVLAIPVLPDVHYTQGHPYLVQHYVARKGGRAVPYLKGHPGTYWVTQKEPPPAPPWGNRDLFVWKNHARGYDYFLVELPLRGPAFDPLTRAPAGEAQLVFSRGPWRVYKNKNSNPDRVKAAQR